MARLVENEVLLPEIERMLNEGKQVRFTPTGVSMRPWIEGGRDAVVLHRADKEVRAGQVLLCRVGERYVLHRLLRIAEDGTLVLQGDGNLVGTETCRREDVMGRAVEVYNARGRRKWLPESTWWLRLPVVVRKYGLKIYRRIATSPSQPRHVPEA